jgi:uncharacterized protein YciI
MFILDLEYSGGADLSKIDALLDSHRAWLDVYYQQGIFLFSGPKKPRAGGIIVALCDSITQIEQITQGDPFVINELVKYRITEFAATKAHKDFVKFIEN